MSTPATILPDPQHLRMLALASDERGIVATVTSIPKAAVCPQCGHPSSRVHSHYVRHVADLPWHGIAFRLRLQVRRFFCDHAPCSQQIFTERLPQVVAPFARTTLRLAQMLQQVAVVLGGAAGRRLVASLGVSGLHQHSAGVSRDTLLRLLRRTQRPPTAALEVVGIDDFAFRRRRGGTILVDLQRHQVVDLLEESSTAVAMDWLAQHPEITVLSRDRGESYAEAARRAAPHAIQVADRWHILHNLSEVTQAVLERHRADLRAVAHALSHASAGATSLQVHDAPSGGAPASPRLAPPVAPPVLAPNLPPATPPATPLATPLAAPPRRPPRPTPPREQHFAEVKQLAAAGWSTRRIAQQLRLNRRTVQRYRVADQFPQRARPAHTISSVARYDAYVRQRWAEGCHIGVQLWAELRARGYQGGLSSLYRALDRLQLARIWPRREAPHGPAPPPRKPSTLRPMSSRQAMWLLTLPLEALTAEQETKRTQLCAICPDAARIYPLVQRLGQLIRERRVADLEAWLVAAEASGVPEFLRFARSLRRDVTAVRQALSSPWSQGPTEGFITKLKLLKRSMYGRGKMDLLCLRLVLSTAG